MTGVQTCALPILGQRVLDLLLGVGVVGALEAPVPLRLLKNLSSLLAGVNTSFYAWHRLRLPKETVDVALLRLINRKILIELLLSQRALVFQVVALVPHSAQELPRRRHLVLLLRP